MNIFKKQQYEHYSKMVNNFTDTQLLKEIRSFRKHFQSHSQYYAWTALNPEDFNNSDRFLILREELNKRDLKESEE